MKEIGLIQKIKNKEMAMNEDEFIEKFAEQGMHCTWNTILPYEYEWTCIACGYSVIKQRNELTKKR